MPVSRTKLKLVDVARQLFAKNGFENTTMNDIAQASQKGRRTLYTYFKNKDEIYYAVIEAELERLSEKVTQVARLSLTPEDKLVELIFTHLSLVKETVGRNGNLRAEFFRNIWMVAKVRKRLDKAEMDTFQSILDEGVRQGTFQVENTGLMSEIMYYCVKGLEVPYICGRLGEGGNLVPNRTVIRSLLARVLKQEQE